MRTQNTGYTDTHAASGLDHVFPPIDVWDNQFQAYEILIDDPEFTSVCPKTSLQEPEGIPVSLPQSGDLSGKHRQPGVERHREGYGPAMGRCEG
jgi:hypothetical protein